MAEAVYILCALTSLLCAVMLLRGYRKTRARLLFWSCACFGCFALTNILLFIDLGIVEHLDLSALRNSITLVGVAMLLFGMIWEI
jgi:hypothetical protein